MINNNPNILLLMNPDRAYERGLVMGILKYSRLHGPFNLIRSEHSVLGELHHLTLKKIRQLQPAGVFWREGHEVKNVDSLGVPTILFPTTEPDSRFCNVVTDDYDIGCRVARHFFARGLKHFAYCGLDDRHYWSRGRKLGFKETIAEAGYPLKSIDLLDPKTELVKWLNNLPKPIGLMVCTDDCSVECYTAIRAAGLKIPGDIAIAGVGNDEIVCDFSNPPLSSVQLNLEETGFRAAEKLSGLIEGRNGNEDIQVEALDVVERPSSNFIEVEDELVERALRFIYEHRNKNIGVEDIVAALPTSRRALYRRFKENLGRSIASEIRMVRINQAARMLVDTSFSIEDISYQMGYDAVQNFSRVFLREKGVTPSKYRKKHSIFA